LTPMDNSMAAAFGCRGSQGICRKVLPFYR